MFVWLIMLNLLEKYLRKSKKYCKKYIKKKDEKSAI